MKPRPQPSESPRELAEAMAWTADSRTAREQRVSAQCACAIHWSALVLTVTGSSQAAVT
jgi:hypothetical protein